MAAKKIIKKAVKEGLKIKSASKTTRGWWNDETENLVNEKKKFFQISLKKKVNKNIRAEKKKEKQDLKILNDKHGIVCVDIAAHLVWNMLLTNSNGF